MASLHDLKTPSLVVDFDRVRTNAARISDVAHRLGVRLRPHIKTHKCVEIARIQTAGHNGAVTVSTLEEARAFAAHGFDDLTYALPIEPGKFDDVFDLTRRGIKLNVLTDDADILSRLDAASAKAGVRTSVFVKIDCGTHRVGVEPNSPEATSIPRAINDAANLDFAGILTHAGHSYNTQSVPEIEAIARSERDTMVELAERLRADGIEVPTVSIGSTPTINHIDHLDGIDEVRPGNYIFFDTYQATIGSCSWDDCALTVLAAVVHRSRDQKKVVIDAGGIALSKDRGPVAFNPGCGYGRVLDLEGNELPLRVDGLSQEHGVVHVDYEALLDRLKVGTRLRILTNHSCMSAAQHSHFNIVEGTDIVDRWVIHRGW